MSTLPKTVTAEEFCDFLNDDVAWKDLYFDDYSEKFYDKHLSFDGKVYGPVKPGEILELEALEAEIGWQGTGAAPSDTPGFLVEFFEQWRDQRDFVYITLKVPRAVESAVRGLMATALPSSVEVKG